MVIVSWKKEFDKEKENGRLHKDMEEIPKFIDEVIHQKDEQFNGNLLHGIGRSLYNFFTMFSILSNIVSYVVHCCPKQLIDPDVDGDLPAHSAINSGASAEVVLLFVTAYLPHIKQILWRKNNRGMSLIDLALEKGHTDTVKKLLRLAAQHGVLHEVLVGGEGSKNVFHISFERKEVWLLKFLLDLHLEHTYDSRILQELLNQLDEKKYAPFHHLMNRICPGKDESTREELENVLRQLQHCGLQISKIALDEHGSTLLHEAYRRNFDSQWIKMLEALPGEGEWIDERGIKAKERDHQVRSLSSNTKLENNFTAEAEACDHGLPSVKDIPSQNDALITQLMEELKSHLEQLQNYLAELQPKGASVCNEIDPIQVQGPPRSHHLPEIRTLLPQKESEEQNGSVQCVYPELSNRVPTNTICTGYQGKWDHRLEDSGCDNPPQLNQTSVPASEDESGQRMEGVGTSVRIPDRRGQSVSFINTVVSISTVT